MAAGVAQVEVLEQVPLAVAVASVSLLISACSSDTFGVELSLDLEGSAEVVASILACRRFLQGSCPLVAATLSP